MFRATASSPALVFYCSVLTAAVSTDDDGLIFASVIVGIPYPERILDGFVTDDRSNLLFLFFLKGQVKKQQRRHIL